MSLKDKFYPEDGSSLTRFDNFMIKSAGKIGEVYQHLTGRSYKDLVNLGYQTAVSGHAIGLLCGRLDALVVGTFPFDKNRNPDYSNGPLEDEIKWEARGYSKYEGKAARASIFLFPTIELFTSYLLLSKSTNKYAPLLGAG
ncbi:MAG: hypothetical protein Q8N63_08170, partial [Nanoarchaeota archaeon]|nr:hypothetical protein [Nanoarchaeota archaeon]